MNDSDSKNGRLITVFFLGALVLTYPLLSLFDRSTLLFGIPLLFLYLFAVWGGLIGLIVFITRKSRPSQPADIEKGH